LAKDAQSETKESRQNGEGRESNLVKDQKDDGKLYANFKSNQYVEGAVMYGDVGDMRFANIGENTKKLPEGLKPMVKNHSAEIGDMHFLTPHKPPSRALETADKSVMEDGKRKYAISSDLKSNKAY
jgi:hypothetical protein